MVSQLYNEQMGNYFTKLAQMQTQVKVKQQPKATNADRIRAMTDEELAKFFHGYVDCIYCPRQLNERCMDDDGSCFLAWVNWLKQEYKECEEK